MLVSAAFDMRVQGALVSAVFRSRQKPLAKASLGGGGSGSRAKAAAFRRSVAITLCPAFFIDESFDGGERRRTGRASS